MHIIDHDSKCHAVITCRGELQSCWMKEMGCPQGSITPSHEVKSVVSEILWTVANTSTLTPSFRETMSITKLIEGMCWKWMLRDTQKLERVIWATLLAQLLHVNKAVYFPYYRSPEVLASVNSSLHTPHATRSAPLLLCQSEPALYTPRPTAAQYSRRAVPGLPWRLGHAPA